MASTLFEASVGERRWPLRPAIVIPDGPSLTYTEMRRQIREVGDFLQKEGVQKEHRVTLALGNSLEYVVAFLAVTSLGAVAAPLIPDHAFEECLYYLADGGIKGLVVGKGQSENARKAARRYHIPVWEFSVVRGKIYCENIPHFYSPEEKGDGPGPYGGESVPNDPSIIHWTGDPPKPTDSALLLYTSGTTSKPKGVLLSHGNLLASLRNIQKTYSLTENDTSFIVMPLFHVHGLIGALLSTLTSGGTAVIPPKFSAHSFWRQFDKHKCTWYSAVPTIHQILLLHSQKTYFGSPSLRFIRSCSAPLAPATLKELENTFSAPVIEAYAMTEASHQMCSNPLPPFIHKAGSVGKGTGVDIKLLDSTGTEVKRGELGEVCLKGPSVMIKGYLHRPEATIQAFHRDGYFRTGDQGYLDEDGYLFLTGRLKELINRGGEKISPPEVDSVLLKHPVVAEAICFGVPHKIYGEEIEAAIVLKEPERDETKLQTIRKAVTEFCKDLLAPFKCPKVIWITNELPKTASGKIQRRNVSEHFVKLAAETLRPTEMEKLQTPARVILSKL